MAQLGMAFLHRDAVNQLPVISAGMSKTVFGGLEGLGTENGQEPIPCISYLQ